MQHAITEKDRKMAQFCLDCPVCKKARKDQKGLIYWFEKYRGRQLPVLPGLRARL